MIKNTNKIIFVRHGQTDHNISDFVQMRDSSLNDIGKEQIKAACAEIAKIGRFEQIITSEFPRCIQSSEIIQNELNIPHIHINQLLNERHHGFMYGMQYEEIQKSHSHLWLPNSENFYLKYNLFERPDGGENYEDVTKRIDTLIEELNAIDKNTIIVGHGIFLRIMLSYFGHFDYLDSLTSVQIKNASIHELT